MVQDFGGFSFYGIGNPPTFFAVMVRKLVAPYFLTLNLTMKNYRLLITASVLSIGTALFIQSCADHKLPAPEGSNCSSEVSYANDVLPIINSSCAIVGNGGCHNGGNGESRDWRVFARVQSHATQIKDRVMRTPGTAGHMPPNGSLTSDQVRLISCWVDQGAQNN